MTALIAALIFIATRSIQIPAVGTSGYIHAGDSIIFLAPVFLGWKRGAIAAAIGAGLADLLSPYAVYTFPTLIIKAIMVLIIGLMFRNKKIEEKTIKRYTFAMILSGIWMIAGYFITEAIITGTIAAAIPTLTYNAIQFIGSYIITLVLYTSLRKTNLIN